MPMDEETRARLQEIADTLEITIEALGEVIETQTRHERQIANIARVSQRLLELQRYEYQQLNERISRLEENHNET